MQNKKRQSNRNDHDKKPRRNKNSPDRRLNNRLKLIAKPKWHDDAKQQNRKLKPPLNVKQSAMQNGTL